MKNLSSTSRQSSRDRVTWCQPLAAALCVMGVLGLGCGAKPAQVADQSRPISTSLNQAIEKLSSGQTIRAIELRTSADPLQPLRNAGQTEVAHSESDQDQDVVLGPSADPCPEIARLSGDAAESEWQEALAELGRCMRAAMEPAQPIRGALFYLSIYRRGLLEPALSGMSDGELTQFLRTEFEIPEQLAGRSDADAPKRLKLRNYFEDRELQEMQRLTRKLVVRLSQAEQAIFAMVQAHRELVDHYASLNDRFGLLRLLHDQHRAQVPPAQALQEVADFVARHGMKVPKDIHALIPAEMLHPWALVAVLPDLGKEQESLQDPIENPLNVMLTALAQLAGPSELVSRQIGHYTSLRHIDNPEPQAHAAPHPQAARIAVLDTGADFQTYSELGEFLSDPRIPGSMGSYDYQDDDRNPWLPASDPESAHGTGTVASILTVLSHYAPAVLASRKVDVAVWKVGTIRSQLSAPYTGRVNWESRAAIPEALIDQATNPLIKIQPQIVSISAIFTLRAFLDNSGHPDAVLKAPWLWVMAAGNQGVEVSKDSIPPCLGDLLPSQRRDENILCVGALERGIVTDSIASYSNFGPRVDLYTYESHLAALCPSGTSCSTPAIAGVAAAVQARYPRLTPAHLKRALVEGSELRLLRVGTLGKKAVTGSAPLRQVRVLDPATMMRKVMRRAAHYSKAQRP